MPTGTISAYSVPDGADVYIDGVAIPTQYGGIARTPAIIPQISAGTHEVTFRLPGYVDDVKTINVTQGGWTSVTGILFPIKTTNNFMYKFLDISSKKFSVIV